MMCLYQDSKINERVFICVLVKSLLYLSTIFALDFRTVLRVLYFSPFYHPKEQISCRRKKIKSGKSVTLNNHFMQRKQTIFLKKTNGIESYSSKIYKTYLPFILFTFRIVSFILIRIIHRYK